MQKLEYGKSIKRDGTIGEYVIVKTYYNPYQTKILAKAVTRVFFGEYEDFSQTEEFREYLKEWRQELDDQGLTPEIYEIHYDCKIKIVTAKEFWENSHKYSEDKDINTE